jgi:arginyl-tRNA synthetase
LKNTIQKLLHDALAQLQQEEILEDIPASDKIEISRTRDSSHGDFSCNLAMKLAKPAGLKPRDLAESLVNKLSSDPSIDKVEIAGPGFINFYLTNLATQSVVTHILQQAEAFGQSEVGKGRSVQVEFVSANPTGPLHVGHGRGAAYGAAVADLLEAIGFNVHREYYVNDAGRQMDILATSVWLRYLELAGEELTFPVNGYKGDYVWDIAATLHREHGDDYRFPTHTVFASIPNDEPTGGDKEKHIDALIARTRSLLDDNRYRYVFELALNTILDNIRRDLSGFGIDFDDWYSERTLTEKGAVNKTILRLQDAGHVYEKDGALWFRSTNFGDEKDRVIQRENGQTTYFASDIAYHLDKLERGFDRVIDVWGADHHGYVPRVKAALQALDQDASKLDVLLVQFANLYSGGEKMQMSTRSGEFVTLRELREEVGRDAARFFYVMRRHDQHLDFDLDLAKSQSSDNPVYYIQYAHARVASVLRQAEEQKLSLGEPQLDRLIESHETELISTLAAFPERVEKAALSEEPHQVAHYLRDLANLFHTYYNAHQFLVDDTALRDTRLALCRATQQVIRNGLALLGVSAPEQM